jgi:DUF971 family protein
MSSQNAWPTEIRLSQDKRTLTVTYDDGARFAIPAELLRVESPSAEVQGHSAAGRQTVPGKRNVAVIDIQPVGSYAVRLRFDDMHDTGIFTWSYLRELGEQGEAKMAAYEAALREKGLSRDPPARR